MLRPNRIFFFETAENISINVISNIRCCVVDLIFNIVGNSVLVRNLNDFLNNGTSNNVDQ
jgi:hypothetical protein